MTWPHRPYKGESASQINNFTKHCLLGVGGRLTLMCVAFLSVKQTLCQADTPFNEELESDDPVLF